MHRVLHEAPVMKQGGSPLHPTGERPSPSSIQWLYSSSVLHVNPPYELCKLSCKQTCLVLPSEGAGQCSGRGWLGEWNSLSLGPGVFLGHTKDVGSVTSVKGNCFQCSGEWGGVCP